MRSPSTAVSPSNKRRCGLINFLQCFLPAGFVVGVQKIIIVFLYRHMFVISEALNLHLTVNNERSAKQNNAGNQFGNGSTCHLGS